MGNSNYHIGVELENRVVAYLNNKYGNRIHLAKRLPGSKSPVDVICIMDHASFIIQCKRKTSEGDMNFSSFFKEENVIKLVKFPNRYTKVLCFKQPRSRDLLFFKWAMPTITDGSGTQYGKWIPFIL